MNTTSSCRMTSRRSGSYAVLLLILISSFTIIRGQQADCQQKDLDKLNINELIQDAERNGASMHQRLPEYTYIQKRITREYGENHKLTVRIREYEAFPTQVNGRHRHILSLIGRDGVPVPGDQIERNRLSAAKEMEQAERGQIPAPEAHEASNPVQYVTAGIGIGSDGTGIWLSASQFLHHCRFSNPRRTEIDGREMIMLDMHSCRVSPRTLREDYLEKIAGTVWIDEADRVAVRFAAWPALSTGSTAEDVIAYEQRRLNTGIWVPGRIRLNGLGRSEIFNGVDKDITFEFSGYQRFSTEITEPDIIAPKKKPIPPQ
ncbi:MAG: hypothetical protein AB7H86_17515 [Blastocatellales bacterium]